MIPNSDCGKTEETQRLAECVHCSDYEKVNLLQCPRSMPSVTNNFFIVLFIVVNMLNMRIKIICLIM